MGDFFKSIRFKILVAVLAFLLAFMLRAAYTGGLAPMTSQILGILTNPLQKASASVSASFSGLFERMIRSGEILEENERLKEENRRLTQRQLEFDKYKLENEQLLKNQPAAGGVQSRLRLRQMDIPNRLSQLL